MKRSTFPLLCAGLISLFLVACGTTSRPAPVSIEGPGSHLVDPRLGFVVQPSRSVQRGFERGWRDFQAGRIGSAERRFTQILSSSPAYLPAKLGLAAVALQNEQPDTAEPLIDAVLERQPEYLAAEAYRAEVAAQRGKLEQAYNIYSELSQRPQATNRVTNRAADIRTRLFDQLYSEALQEPTPQRAIVDLRKALAVREAPAARILLVQKLIGIGKFDDARRQVEPLVTQQGMEREVQEALVEIEVGTAHYQEAISRMERLASDYPEPRYQQRLEEIKRQWSEVNMPQRYHDAVSSGAITRVDLAVLIYWKIPAVRFAQNLPEPPIATDLNGPGREEMIRALALRLMMVDPLMRQAAPDRFVTPASLLRILTRLVAYRGLPCVRSTSVETAPARALLESCGIDLSGLADAPEGVVRGRVAASILDEIARRFQSGE